MPADAIRHSFGIQCGYCGHRFRARIEALLIGRLQLNRHVRGWFEFCHPCPVRPKLGLPERRYARAS